MANIIDAILRLTDNFTPTLERARNGLTQYSRQAQRVGKDLQKIGDNISDVGKTLTTAVTAPIVGAGVASLKTTMDFEQSMSRVKALSGSTAEEMEKLNALAIKLGADTSMASSDVSEAMQYMALAGWKAQDMIEGTTGIISLATASGEELALVSDIVTDALSAFGLSAKDSSHFADVLAGTVTNSNTTVAMMGEAFTYVSSVAGAFNYTIEDTALAIGLMANSGIKASQAGTALRKIMTETNGAFEVVGDTLGKYVIQTTDANGSMIPFKETMIEMRKVFSQLTDAEKATNAEAIAGKTGMAGLLAIINASEKDFNKLAEAIDNSTGSAEKMSETMLDNLWGQVELISGGIESLALMIGQKLTPYARQLADVVQGVVDKLTTMSDEQLTSMMKMAGIIAIIPPMIMLYGKLVKGVGSAFIAYGKFSGAVRRAGSVMKVIFSPANTIVLVMTAIALVALLVIKYWQPITVFFKGAFDKIKSILENAGVDFNELKDTWNMVKDSIGRGIEALWNFFVDFWGELQPLLQALVQFIQVVCSAWIGHFQGLLTGVGDIINGVMTTLSGLIDFIVGVFTANWSLAWDGVVNVFKGIFEGIVGIGKSVINGIIGMINGAIKGINNIGSVEIAGKVVGVSIPEIPMLYRGTDNWQGGTAMIHDRGAEIVDLPKSSRVYPHDESIKKAFNDGANSSTGFTIAKLADTIVVREDADVDKIANALYNKFKKHALNMA